MSISSKIRILTLTLESGSTNKTFLITHTTHPSVCEPSCNTTHPSVCEPSCIISVIPRLRWRRKSQERKIDIRNQYFPSLSLFSLTCSSLTRVRFCTRTTARPGMAWWGCSCWPTCGSATPCSSRWSATPRNSPSTSHSSPPTPSGESQQMAFSLIQCLQNLKVVLFLESRPPMHHKVYPPCFLPCLGGNGGRKENLRCT